MDRYLVVSPHVPEECYKTVNEVLFMGHITHFDWGCKDSDHTGWGIVEADSRTEALLSVPPFIRHKARAIKLTKFSPEDVKAMHEKV